MNRKRVIVEATKLDRSLARQQALNNSQPSSEQFDNGQLFEVCRHYEADDRLRVPATAFNSLLSRKERGACGEALRRMNHFEQGKR